MGFFQAVNTVFAGFFKFSGRATRPEYWWFFLFEIIVVSVLLVLDVWMFINASISSQSTLERTVASLSPFDFLLFYYFIITFFPRMAVTIRRLHDVGLSGFFYLLYFVPIVGGLVVFVLTLLPSEGDDNIHGPHRPGGSGPRHSPDGSPRKHDPMQGYAVLDKIKEDPTPEMIAARKAEVRALYEQRVLGKGPIVAE
ncbi:DUF805 domain-containing protein [Tateyamaria armeniaca]|uniref:DUF805 domain-containing protein n=1 Tax=Tateyamaria armeniaca TaxID=2518930 RepID=A0ABW8USY6_9RHOB